MAGSILKEPWTLAIPCVDAAIIGGGIVGLSCAYSISKTGLSVMVLERHLRMGEQASTHNSGVIHAGIYYEPGSLKAKLCVEGAAILRTRLKEWKIPHKISGKLIAAVDSGEEALLEPLYLKGVANNVRGLKLIGRKKIRQLEPNINATAALYSPNTGVFDVADYLYALQGRAEKFGAVLVTGAEVVGVERGEDCIILHTGSRGSVKAAVVVNSAGLYSDDVAGLCGETGHKIHPCRGEYAVVVPSKSDLVNALVYPVPAVNSLGIHLTKTVHGELWLGPTARFIRKKDDYEQNRLSLEEFIKSAGRLCPGLNLSDLRPGQTGIRAKSYGPGEPAADFYIARQGNDRRIIHLIGIESPGLTASPAIGEQVMKMVAET